MQANEGKGWRGLATRAGLLHPRSRFFSEKCAPLLAPRLPSFGISPLPCEESQGKRRRPLSLFSEASHLDSGVQLSGTHAIGRSTFLETLLQGSSVHLAELRLRIVRKLLPLSERANRRLCQTANVAFSLATDFQYSSRVTLESTMGTKEDGHTVSGAVSSDFMSQLALGLATSHRLSKSFTFFSRYSRDDYAGERLIIQAVHELNAKNRLSMLYAATMGQHPQAGFSWIYESSNGVSGDVKESLSLKALCSGDGAFSLGINVQFGSIN